jgi:phosphoribosylformylglycinamidine (FGAM) synthase PurS component
MPHRIEIGLKSHIRDALGEKLKRRIREDLNVEVQSVNTIVVYTIDADLSPEELEMVASGPFSDPITQVYAIDRPLAQSFDWLIEVGFRPGVTDNVGKTAREAIELRLGVTLNEEERVYTVSHQGECEEAGGGKNLYRPPGKSVDPAVRGHSPPPMEWTEGS